MHGRIRKEHSEVRIPWRDRLCRRIQSVNAPTQEDNRRGRRGEPTLLLIRHGAEPPHRLHTARHHGERLCLAPLALPEPRDRRLAARIAREMIAADALDGENAAVRHNAARLCERITRRLRPVHNQTIGGTADGARIRLRVKAAVGGVVILVLTCGAHPKRSHRGQWPIVGHTANDGVARPAVRAVRKGVAMPPICRREDLTPTVRANRKIGRDERPCRRPLRALQNAERLLPLRRNIRERHRCHGCGKRCLRAKSIGKVIERRRRTLRLDPDARAVIQHPAAESVFCSKPIDEGTKAHALHNP